jgi:hypothetical protein
MENTLTHIETETGLMDIEAAKAVLAAGGVLVYTMSQVVMGVWSDGRKTSLKCRKDGFYYMSGNYAA